MATTSPNRHPTALVARSIARPLELGLVAFGLLVLVVTAPTVGLWLLAAWVIGAYTYIVLSARHLYRASRDPARNRIHLPSTALLRGTWSTAIHIDAGIIAFASLMGLLGAFVVLRGAPDSGYAVLSRAIAALSILGAWMLLQFGFSRLYADSYFHKDPPGGLSFPDTEVPGLVEFAYFTFSVGATFQTSDTSVTNTHMRWLVTVQGVLCFIYNSVLLAFAVSIILGG